MSNTKLMTAIVDDSLALLGAVYQSHLSTLFPMTPGDRLNIKMSSYQYRDPHIKDKTISRPSDL